MVNYYHPQVRLIEDQGKTLREYLHYDHVHLYAYATFEAAEAALDAEVNETLSEWDNVTVEKIETYTSMEGGGFYFKASDGTEGRALVITAQVVLAEGREQAVE